MKKRAIFVCLCAILIGKSVLTASAAAGSDDIIGKEIIIGENQTGNISENEDDAVSISGNIPERRLIMKEEEELFAKLASTAAETLRNLLSNRTVSALVYLCDNYEVKEEATQEAQTVVILSSGQTVFIKDIAITDEGDIWYRVSAYVGEQEYAGYIERKYLAYSDEVFIEWEQEVINPEISVSTMENARASQDIAQFPASYQSKLQMIKNAHPKWTFVKMNTNLSWDSVISNELGERSLVPASSPALWKSGSYSTGWSYATEEIIKYYMDPRNFFDDTTIFQFEQLTYNASYHTQASVQGVLSNTFMSGKIPGDSRTYANVFWETGNNLGVSPFHLACRVYQEQGKGTSPLISGTYKGYENLYNYFNIGATGSTDTAVITNGLARAGKEGWTTRYASIYGGAKILSANYILKGQDTLYLQKFDVDSSHNGLYWHQYMQNICAPESESKNIRKAYANSGSLDNTFVFKIPVYNNMPAAACGKPGEEQVQPPADRTKIDAFVKRLYQVALGREADSKGLAYWSEELAEGRKTGAVAAKGFILSPEMNNRKLNNDQYVTMLYQTFFDRKPVNEDSGKAFWIKLLENGVSRAYVFKGFCHSEEFAAICSDYGINRGTVTLTENRDQKHDLTMYVYRCYNRTLGRTPDVDGLNYWTGQLINKQRNASEVAANFVFSKEFINKKYSDTEYVKIMYRMFFDREYDNAGLEFWLNELKTGKRDRYKVFVGFANSKEFKAVLDIFGL